MILFRLFLFFQRLDSFNGNETVCSLLWFSLLYSLSSLYFSQCCFFTCIPSCFSKNHYSSSFVDLETSKYSPVILVFHPALFVAFFGATFEMPMFFSDALFSQVNKQSALTCCYCLTWVWRGMNEGTRTDLNSWSVRPNKVVVTAMTFVLPMMIKRRIMLVIMNNRRDSCQGSVPFVNGSCV